MKYIKEFKDIDWDDFDIEEDDPNTHKDFEGNEKFYKFLKDNNVLDRYMNNYDPFYEGNGNISLFKFLNICMNKNYIFKAFLWSETYEKFGFWDNINSKWREIINYI